MLHGPPDPPRSAIVQANRRCANDISAALAEQVMGALVELLAGFESARTRSGDALLTAACRDDLAHLYDGLLTALMRLVFLLDAEAHGLLPDDPSFANGYALSGLYEQLGREARFHAPLDQRYGAWAHVLALFSTIYFGAPHPPLRHPPRWGDLFNPNTYPFLEGRPYRTERGPHDPVEPPRIADSVVLRVLHRLVVLEPHGRHTQERIAYGALDVEHLGSVYEAMTGYTLERAAGPSLCLKPHHRVVDLAALLAMQGEQRLKALAAADVKLSGSASGPVKRAIHLDALAAALAPCVSSRQPGLLAPGTLCVQPTQERRRSGSHYTPQELTRPIVEQTLAPLLARLRAQPGGMRASDVLALKVCDPAMGAGAFLIEVCRQLATAVTEAWERFPEDQPTLPPNESVGLFAMRLVAQRCLYGVDKNSFAVALAKLSLWLLTRAHEHPFTFVDHALRTGDSLVGLGHASSLRVAGASVPPTSALHRPPQRAPRAGDLLQRRAALDTQPFHWAVAFPEVFEREHPGFDAFVGNPPFLGGTRISTALGKPYLTYLMAAFPACGNRMDLVAYFFRRAFALLRTGGTLGFVATNTIAQGDTRQGGLRWIRQQGGIIYAARRRCRWPGDAAVVVSVVHIAKGGP